ncbi:Ubiquitin-conjugating enzyme E2 6 [Zancudomyces culisetae]|uniref:Ubiquitin-conjugating enzyme E2 6 n=1 Tax=Zancudomyces culisetae TaxID=1213189 RepID=A0A1R1PYD2_ZANCU|nr:Ubiquitin-conjugating enzyme E2 6 [Zancudomyces culisetae]|eukprot:OMH85939.1 Ubiquitin-conjugating enzyme E2 6 [Zancudomyces culisetae]
MSNFHPNTWNPAWSVSTIVTGLLSFMVEEEMTTGSVRMTPRDRKLLAKKSHSENIKNSVFRKVFPELAGKEMNESIFVTDVVVSKDKEAGIKTPNKEINGKNLATDKVQKVQLLKHKEKAEMVSTTTKATNESNTNKIGNGSVANGDKNRVAWMVVGFGILMYFLIRLFSRI